MNYILAALTVVLIFVLGIYSGATVIRSGIMDGMERCIIKNILIKDCLELNGWEK